MKNEEARAARDAGIQQAAEHAEEASPNWGDRAFEVLRMFAAAKRASGSSFTSEDVSNSILGAHLPQPPHLRLGFGVPSRCQGRVDRQGGHRGVACSALPLCLRGDLEGGVK